MQIDVLRLIVVVVFIGVLIVAGLYDYAARRIPNWTVLCLLGLFVPTAFLGAQPVSLGSSIAGFTVAFAVTGVLWSVRIIGGGDAKLFSALSLFFGLKYLLIFVAATSISGGLVALVMLLRRPTQALVMLQVRGKGKLGRGVPYGIAIAGGGLVAAWLSGFLWHRTVLNVHDLDYLRRPTH